MLINSCYNRKGPISWYSYRILFWLVKNYDDLLRTLSQIPITSGVPRMTVYIPVCSDGNF